MGCCCTKQSSPLVARSKYTTYPGTPKIVNSPETDIIDNSSDSEGPPPNSYDNDNLIYENISKYPINSYNNDNTIYVTLGVQPKNSY